MVGWPVAAMDGRQMGRFFAFGSRGSPAASTSPASGGSSGGSSGGAGGADAAGRERPGQLRLPRRVGTTAGAAGFFAGGFFAGGGGGGGGGRAFFFFCAGAAPLPANLQDLPCCTAAGACAKVRGQPGMAQG